MSSKQMFSLWWKEKWVRYLVLSICPIGFVDGLFTILLYNTHGLEYEYNPIVRYALEHGFWLIWLLIDIVSFMLFGMIIGSYYLHTRSSIFGNHTGILAGLVAFRLGIAVYNVLLFFDTYSPAIVGTITGIMTFIAVDRLFNRKRDISWRGFRGFWRSKYDRMHDYLLTRGLDKKDKEIDVKMTEMQKQKAADSKSIWLKRALYLSVPLLVFLATPFILTVIGNMTGVSAFSDIFGPLVFWNQLSGVGFISGFIVILILMSIMIFFILKAFNVEEGGW